MSGERMCVPLSTQGSDENRDLQNIKYDLISRNTFMSLTYHHPIRKKINNLFLNIVSINT